MNTLGFLLKKTRERKRLTIDEISKATKINNKYLYALENDDYSQFSDLVHSKGFLKIYANYLELNESEVLALWRRDYSTHFTNKTAPKDLYGKYSKSVSTFVFTPSTIFISVFILFVLSFFVYFFVQYKNYVGAPDLVITSPENNLVVTDSIVRVEGKSSVETEVFVNDQKITVAPDGSFSTALKVREGLNSIIISARNKLNRTSEKIVNIVYSPLPSTPIPNIPDVLETTPSIEDTQTQDVNTSVSN